MVCDQSCVVLCPDLTQVLGIASYPGSSTWAGEEPEYEAIWACVSLCNEWSGNEVGMTGSKQSLNITQS